jgi:hypothetical protein
MGGSFFCRLLFAGFKENPAYPSGNAFSFLGLAFGVF